MKRGITRAALAMVFGIALVTTVFQVTGASQNRPEEEPGLTYSRGQSVQPLYHGWQKNADGATDFHFGYINRNWEEQVDVPIGPNNIIAPAEFAPNGDGGQPTHFLPRNNRWQFTVRVPKGFEDTKREVVWTLTTRGERLSATSTFESAFYQDQFGLQREFYGEPGAGGNRFPEVKVETKQVTAKVGEPVTISAIATDDGVPARREFSPEVAGTLGFGRRVKVGGNVGGVVNRPSPAGLRFAWYVYRGGPGVRFNPPQYDVWENTRSGANSPYSNNWDVPPVPPGNRWINQVTFSRPGTYVIRGRADDSIAWGYGEVSVTVTE